MPKVSPLLTVHYINQHLCYTVGMAQKRRPLRRGTPGVAHRLHERILVERAKRDLTIDALAALSGVGRATLDRLPWVENPPTVETVGAIAEALEIPIEEALRLAGHPIYGSASEASAPVRAAILANPVYPKAIQDALITVINVIDAAYADDEGRDVG